MEPFPIQLVFPENKSPNEKSTSNVVNVMQECKNNSKKLQANKEPKELELKNLSPSFEKETESKFKAEVLRLKVVNVVKECKDQPTKIKPTEGYADQVVAQNTDVENAKIHTETKKPSPVFRNFNFG